MERKTDKSSDGGARPSQMCLTHQVHQFLHGLQTIEQIPIAIILLVISVKVPVMRTFYGNTNR